MFKKSSELIVLYIDNKLNLPLFPDNVKKLELVINKVLDLAKNNTLLFNLKKIIVG